MYKITNIKQNKERTLSKGKLYDVVIIRSLAIIMVVAFHSYGMMYAESHFPKSNTMYYDLYYNINQIILKFRMPLFIFISGYLFSYLEKYKGKYPTFKALFKNKFHRLILPYFVFAVVYMLTTDSFSFNTLISGGCAHFWFITMLFWCFILTRLLSFTQHTNKISFKLIILTFSFALILVTKDYLPHFLGLYNLPKWYFWFYLGYTVYPHREYLLKYLSNKLICIILFLIYLISIYYAIQINDTTNIYVQLGFLSIVLLIWFLINKVIYKFNGKWLENEAFKELNRTSYGIFVLHNWLQLFMISNTSKRLFNLDILAENHVVLFPLFFFLLSLLFSYIGAVLMLRTRIGRLLIG